MKRLSLLMAALVCAGSLFAQKRVDVVYLKNGGLVRGEIIEQVPDKSLKIQTADGNIFVYSMSDVERIAREEKQTAAANGHGHRGLDFTMSGFVTANKYGAGGGGMLELGKRFSPNLYYGGSVSVGKGVSMVALTGIKAFFPVSQAVIVPNLDIETGVEHDFGSETNSWVFQLMPGMQLPLGKKADLNINVGYSLGVGLSSGLGVGHSFIAKVGVGLHKPWEKKNRAPRPVIPTRDTGVELMFDASLMSPWNIIILGADMLAGYKLSPNISVGLGYGFGAVQLGDGNYREHNGNYYTAYRDGDVYMTHKVFLRGLYRLNDKKLSPMATLDLGWRIYNNDADPENYDHDHTWEPFIKSAFFIAPSLGGSLRVRNNSYLDVRLGYDISKKYNSSGDDYTYSGASRSGFFFSFGYRHTFGKKFAFVDKLTGRK